MKHHCPYCGKEWECMNADCLLPEQTACDEVACLLKEVEADA